MKNFIRLLSVIAFLISIQQSYALVKEKSKVLGKSGHILATTFLDYPPFGKKAESGSAVQTVYQPFIDALKENSNQKVSIVVDGTYKNLVFKVFSSEIDIILGAYFDTEIYNGLEFIYPSIVNNPVVSVSLPDRGLKISSKKDLQGLKGAIDSREHFSDYVQKELKKLNIQTFNDSEKLYEQLFIGNIDYILTSRYYGALEQAKLGIRDMVQMPKEALWDMPLFIGVSSFSKHAKLTANTIKTFLKTHHEEVREKINQYIVDIIHQADEDNRGVVPPSFVK